MTADLIHDLETAEAGSRELDGRVLLALGWRQTAGDEHHQEYWIDPNDDGLAWHWAERPAPSQSVDDCLYLLPEGLAMAHEYHPPKHYEWQIELPGGEWLAASGNTPALAFSAALVKASEVEKA